MNDQTDQQLLRNYAERRSEAAFTELVRRHVDLVHSAAFRLTGEAHSAQDVTQAVFVALAQHAGRLTHHPVLSGWLHTTARNLAAKNVRAAVRRQNHEQEAAAMNALLSTTPEASWEEIAPHLDAALGDLTEPERDVVLLRYFERKSAGEIAGIVGISEAAAQKRVSRAVERLREFFAKRGVAVGTGGLVAVIFANAVQAAPTGLAITVSATAIAGTAVTTAAVAATTTATIAMTTLQKTLVAATLAVLAGAGIYEARQAAQLRDQVQSLQRQQSPLEKQISQLQSDNVTLSNRLARTGSTPSLESDRLRELLRLRGEVGVLRRQQRELEHKLALAKSQPAQPITQPTSQVDPQRAVAAPFQLQLVVDEPTEDSELLTNSTGNVAQALRVQKNPLMNHTAIRSATVTPNSISGAPQIDIEFNEVGKELFAAVTRENLNKRLAIVLGGQLYSAPVIRTEIPGGKAQITGNFTEEEAKVLAAKINDAIKPQ